MRIFLSLLFLLAAIFPLSSQDIRDMDWYLEEAGTALEGERYEYAVSVLTEAEKAFPGDAVFPAMLGDIFYDQELYGLALKEYEQARIAAPEDYNILYSLATTQGRLNMDIASASTLENILEFYPDSLDVIIDLGWMYFKTFQLARGEQILTDAVETFGESPALCMTLGTIYSGMYEYESSSTCYLRSIDLALEEGRKYFASVAYYNLSLLQQGFYRFDDALESTRRSLETAERAPGHIALGELCQLRAEYRRAREEYEQAFNLDTTPLAMVNLADLNIELGRPEEALAFLEEVSNASDNSWMYYFGTDIKRHQMELHRIYADVYEALAVKAMKTPGGLPARLVAPFRYIGRKALAWYHGRKYMALCLDVGSSYLEDGNELDANWYFYKGNTPYEAVALKYLELAERFETSIAPEAAPYYLLERGILLSDPGFLSAALRDLEDPWEKGGRGETLAHLAPLGRKAFSADTPGLYQELFILNPGAFIRYGLDLPVYPSAEVSRALRRRLNRSYIKTVGDPENAAYIFSLVSLADGKTEIRLLDPGTERVMTTILSEFSSSSRRENLPLAEDIIAKLFNIE